ncbi:putative globular PEP-CTERM protein [Geminisphaera colitermitum]|uniref:putative globular PEP-CTERM protein n=1 Tax=Geminisphaera colitermitum TaxID=1148786 RepID=UPI000158C9F8|nr:putative globular PEP-CTERM protein [Geminisphaera colitermitum]
MKTSIKASVIALVALIASHAAWGASPPASVNFSNDPDYFGSGNKFLDEDGNGLSGYDNYVIGLWYQTYGTTDQWTFLGGGLFEDRIYPEYGIEAGYVESTPGGGIPVYTQSSWTLEGGWLTGDTITFMARAWQYPGDATVATITSLQQLEDSFYNLVTGSKYAEVTWQSVDVDPDFGTNIGVNFPGAVLDQVVGAVPEPSTYAALAGLALLAYAYVMRRHR